MPSLGSLFVNIGANAAGLEQGLNGAEQRLRGFDRSVRNTVKVTALLTAGAAAAGASIIANLVNSGRIAIDSQAKLARSMDGTISGLRALDMAAGDAGVSSEELGGELVRLNARLGDAAKGSGASFDALQRLGLVASDFVGLDIDDKAALIADRMNALGLSGSQAADVMRDLGVRNENLTQLMRQGGDAIREQAQEVRDLGLSLSMVDAAAVERANDSLGIMGDILTGVQDRMAVAAAPFIEVIAENLRTAAIESGGFRSEIEATINTILRGVGKAGDALMGLRIVFKTIEVVARGFAAGVATAFELVLKGVDTLFSSFSEKARKAGEYLSYIPGPVGMIGQALKAVNDTPLFDGVIEGAESLRQGLFNAQAELQSLITAVENGEIPSTQIEKFLADVAAAREQLAEQEAAGGGAPVIPGMSDEEVAKIQERLEMLRASYQTELQDLQAKFGQEQEILAQAKQAQLLTQEQYDNQMLEAERRYQGAATALEQRSADERKRIARQEADARMATLQGAFGGMSTLMNSESRKLFEIGKAAGIANAVVSTYTGMTNAFRDLPYWLAVPAAAGIAAAGFSNIAAIRAQQFGGGGAGAAATGSNTAAVNAASSGVAAPGSRAGSAAGGPAGPTYTFTGIEPGKLYNGRDIAAALEDYVANGGRLQIGGRPA